MIAILIVFLGGYVMFWAVSEALFTQLTFDTRITPTQIKACWFLAPVIILELIYLVFSLT